jgi:hypothetical protein
MTATQPKSKTRDELFTGYSPLFPSADICFPLQTLGKMRPGAKIANGRIFPVNTL